MTHKQIKVHRYVGQLIRTREDVSTTMFKRGIPGEPNILCDTFPQFIFCRENSFEHIIIPLHMIENQIAMLRHHITEADFQNKMLLNDRLIQVKKCLEYKDDTQPFTIELQETLLNLESI